MNNIYIFRILFGAKHLNEKKITEMRAYEGWK